VSPDHLEPLALRGIAGSRLQTRTMAAQSTLKFTGTEDYEYQASFVNDDTAINVS